MEFISFDIFCQSMETRFSHFLLNLSMLTFGIKVNKDLPNFPHIRVDTSVHSPTSTTYSSIRSSKRVTDEGMNTNLQNASVEQENDAHLNEIQNEETVLKEGGLFHPPEHYFFPKIRIGTRNRSC